MSYRDDPAARAALERALDREVVAALPGLAELRVASPCEEPWAQMAGDDRVRHCRRCDQDVYDLSALTREEVADLLYQRGAELCARFYRRGDGTIMTADCVDVRRLRTRRRLVTAAASTVIAAAVAVAGGVGAGGGGRAGDVAELDLPPDPEQAEPYAVDEGPHTRVMTAGALSISWSPLPARILPPAPARPAVDPRFAPDELPRISDCFSGDPDLRGR